MTEKERNEMRALFRGAKDPAKQIKILQELYQVSRKEVLEVLDLKVEPRQKHRKFKYPLEMRIAVAEAARRGEPQAEIAKRFGIAKSTVYYWANEG